MQNMKEIFLDILLIFVAGLLIGLSITLLIILPFDKWTAILGCAILIRIFRLCFERDDFYGAKKTELQTNYGSK